MKGLKTTVHRNSVLLVFHTCLTPPPEPICLDDFWAKEPEYAREMSYFPIFRQLFNTSGNVGNSRDVSEYYLVDPGKSADQDKNTTGCYKQLGVYV
jgi:hypothetical protein